MDEGVIHRKQHIAILLHPTPPAEAPLGCCCCNNPLPHILIGHHPLILNCLKLPSFLHSSPLVLSNTFIQFLHYLLNFIPIACSLTCMSILIQVEPGKILATNHCQWTEAQSTHNSFNILCTHFLHCCLCCQIDLPVQIQKSRINQSKSWIKGVLQFCGHKIFFLRPGSFLLYFFNKFIIF